MTLVEQQPKKIYVWADIPVTAYWKLEGNGNDESGNGNTLNVTNQTFTNNGSLTYASFNGSGYSNITNFSLSSSFTIIAWLKKTSDATKTKTVWSWLGAHVYSYSEGSITFSYTIEGGGTQGLSTDFSTDTWAMFAFQYDGNNVRLYKFTSETPTIVTNNNAAQRAFTYDFMIGSDNNSWIGYISKFIISNNYSWTEDELKGWFNQTKSDYGY